MPVAGLVRLRKHQFGRQAAIGTVVPATRAYPFSGVPSHDLSWTDQEVDAGSLFVTAPPVRQAPDLTAGLDLPQLNYNDLVLPLCGIVRRRRHPVIVGDVAAAGSTSPRRSLRSTWSTRSRYQFGDDVLTDWYQYGDGSRRNPGDHRRRRARASHGLRVVAVRLHPLDGLHRFAGLGHGPDGGPLGVHDGRPDLPEGRLDLHQRRRLLDRGADHATRCTRSSCASPRSTTSSAT